jgi:hypothetical protein
MQGYIRVSPKGSKVALKWNSPSYKAVADADDADEHAERPEHDSHEDK